jgi:hypothetical protein
MSILIQSSVSCSDSLSFRLFVMSSGLSLRASACGQAALRRSPSSGWLRCGLRASVHRCIRPWARCSGCSIRRECVVWEEVCALLWLLSLFPFRFNANERHASPSPPPMHVSTTSPSHRSRIELVLLAHSASVSHGHIAQCLCGYVCCCCPALRGCHLHTNDTDLSSLDGIPTSTLSRSMCAATVCCRHRYLVSRPSNECCHHRSLIRTSTAFAFRFISHPHSQESCPFLRCHAVRLVSVRVCV